ncbi:MAG TPA: hypothetical protein VGL95_07935, partial [Acetobacteraceae bacterium]
RPCDTCDLDACRLDDVFIGIQDGAVPEILAHDWRDASAANRFFERLPKRPQYLPQQIVTD